MIAEFKSDEDETITFEARSGRIVIRISKRASSRAESETFWARVNPDAGAYTLHGGRDSVAGDSLELLVPNGEGSEQKFRLHFCEDCSVLIELLEEDEQWTLYRRMPGVPGTDAAHQAHMTNKNRLRDMIGLEAEPNRSRKGY